MKKYIQTFLGSVDGAEVARDLYGNVDMALVQARYSKICSAFEELFIKNGLLPKSTVYHIFSASGRTEVGGNHTDHNLGRVLAGSITLDSLCVAAPVDDKPIVKLYSKGYDRCFEVDLSSPNGFVKRTDEENTTEGLVRGVAAGFVDAGHKVSGFCGYIDSNVLSGSGLSSSASIEVLIGTIFSELFNAGQISPVEIAKIGQYAENVFFGKPSGLMDQVACANGGLVAIDFQDPKVPVIEPVQLNLDDFGYSMLVVDTKGSHANLTPHYAAIPKEMGEAASIFGRKVMREVSKPDFYKKIPEVRKAFGDRAVLRGMHFLKENSRVPMQIVAIQDRDFRRFLELVNASGASSWKYLQNISSPDDSKQQEIALGLALTEDYLDEIGEGAVRIHGGGFAGTILVFLPKKDVAPYRELIEAVFGSGCVTELGFRKRSACMVV